ncbi:sirohydrochlorin cobaltochelatase [uncultured Clostridium sp.]|uniref:sirohydrochlorin cobaltochelatase n=1 Tax=Clostridium sp. TaxID=1506 RepID=UPI0025E7F227|nr:sirohydrochlorin cobaltochelatase [uncultured Clostridium sp.]
MSKAIVLVAFGSANLEGIKKSIGLLEKDLEKCFGEDYTIFKAFTSNKVIDLLKERYDYVVPHLSKVLFNLVNQGYEEVIIQPLHIMSGRDKNQIEETVNEYKYSMKKLVISKSLFTEEEENLNKESYEVGRIISENIGNNDILLVGHGSKRSSNKLYDVIEEAVRNITDKRVYMATLEGEKTIDTVIEKLVRDKVNNLIVKPLFIIPGKHVVSDISIGEGSWIEMLRERNINITINEDSLLQYEKIRKLYIRNINEVI